MKNPSHYTFVFIYIILFLVFPAHRIIAGEDGGAAINFRNLTYAQAISASFNEKKPLYIHCYAEWCEYCKYMMDSVYTDKEVADYFNANFICIKMDMEKEGKELNTVFKIHNFPTMIFYDSNGEFIHRAAGRKYKPAFLEIGKEALDPKRNMRAFKNKYENGKASPGEVQIYFRMMEMAGMDAQPLINEYLLKQSDKDFTNKNNWRIIYDIIKDPMLPVMTRFLDNKGKLESIYTPDSVNNKLLMLYNTYLMHFVQQLDTINYRKATDEIIANSKLGISEKIIAYASLNKLRMNSDWNAYKVEGKKFIEEYALNDSRRLLDVAQVYYERFNADRESMVLAEQWARKSVSLADFYKANHLLASILFLSGQKDEALKIANHAVELAQRDKNDYLQTTQLIAVMCEGQ